MTELLVDNWLDARNLSLADIDLVRFSPATYNSELLINASQIGPGLISLVSHVVGGGAINTITIHGAVDLSGWTFQNWTLGPGGAAVRYFQQEIVIVANNEPSFIVGTRYDERITGSNFDDIIHSGGGGDEIDAGGGNDRVVMTEPVGYRTGYRLNGGSGIDTLVMIHGGDDTGQGFKMYRDANGRLAFGNYGAINFEIVEITGTSSPDILVGLDLDDTLHGMGGDDQIFGFAGNDVLRGGSGNDELRGGSGADLLDGEGGYDYAAYNDSGANILVDMIFGGLNTGEAYGDDFRSIEGLAGGAHDDDLRGDHGDNWIFGNDGNDVLYGRGGNDALQGGEGTDTLFGEDGDDRLFGWFGNDHMHGNAGADAFDGGDGRDYVRYDYAPTGIVADLLFAASQNTGEAAGDSYVSVENLVGSAFGDDLRGDQSANDIWGGSGNDHLYGRDGNDLLIGDSGNDYLAGENGNDTFFFSGAFGHDTIADFFAGNGPGDQIWLNLGPQFDSYAKVMAVSSQVGSDTLLNLGGGQTITLKGLQQWSLAVDDFRFS